MKFYIIEELYFYSAYDTYGSEVLSKGFADQDKAWEFVKNLTMSEPDSVASDEMDESRHVRAVQYDTSEVVEYHIQEIEVEL